MQNFNCCALYMMSSQSASPKQIMDNLIQLLEERGTGDYIGESISQLEHSLQCANFGLKSGATSPALIISPATDEMSRKWRRNGDCSLTSRYWSISSTWRCKRCPDGNGWPLCWAGWTWDYWRGVFEKSWFWGEGFQIGRQSCCCEKVSLKKLCTHFEKVKDNMKASPLCLDLLLTKWQPGT